jgi:glyoxylase-like metal-dependent hydrolase (beta-lactamase superfamily II)
MLKWQVGDVTISRIVELEMSSHYSTKHPFIPDATPERMREPSWLHPHFVTPEGNLNTSIHALLVDAPGLRLVVDTCIGNDRPRRILAKRPLSLPFLERFAESGWKTTDVNAVVCTHLHVDHVGWNTMLVDGKWTPTFPNARYLIGRREFEHWTAEGEGETKDILADSVQPIFDAGLAHLVDMDHRITNELRLMPTPGHTPGHVSVVIESKGQRAIITGDLMHHPCQIAHPDWCAAFDSNQAAAHATREQFLRDVTDTDTLVIGTHFAAPTAGHVIRDGDAYRLVS